MTTAVLGYSKIHKKVQATVDSLDFPNVNWKMVCIVGFFVCLPLLVLYVFQINDLTKGSYSINNYEKQIAKLSSENRNLQVSFAENSFLGQALIKVKALNFQKVTSVKYIQIPDTSVAKAK